MSKLEIYLSKNDLSLERGLRIKRLWQKSEHYDLPMN